MHVFNHFVFPARTSVSLKNKLHVPSVSTSTCITTNFYEHTYYMIRYTQPPPPLRTACTTCVCHPPKAPTGTSTDYVCVCFRHADTHRYHYKLHDVPRSTDCVIATNHYMYGMHACMSFRTHCCYDYKLHDPTTSTNSIPTCMHACFGARTPLPLQTVTNDTYVCSNKDHGTTKLHAGVPTRISTGATI